MSYIFKYTPNAITAAAKVIYDKFLDYKNNDTFNAKTKRLSDQPNFFTQASHFFGDPVHIIDNIYIGSAFNAASYYKLKDTYNISIIINATKEISNYYPKYFTYKNYDLSDVNEDSIKQYLENAYQFIKKNKDKQILVHCFMGASRSASLITYYIMKEYDMSMEQVVEFMTDKRKIVNINTTFAQEIEDSVIIEKND